MRQDTPFSSGVIEGFFGAPWSYETRIALIEAWAKLGISSYLYAPKSDRNLREGWRTPHTQQQQEHFQVLSRTCRGHGLSFGMGLSPYELYKEPLEVAEAQLLARVADLVSLGLDSIAILFDDMRGDVEGLATSQAHLVNAVHRAFGDQLKVTMCPSYYTTDPILDRVFGARPHGYITDLGTLLDPAVGVYWTGPKVCSSHYPADHLLDVSERLKRKPLIWDNYPVNDGPKMCKHLHLEPFSTRAALLTGAAGVVVNPMNQGWLSLLPLSSLEEALTTEEKSGWRLVFSESLQGLLARDAALFKRGLDEIPPATAERLVAEYSKQAHPAATEVISWLRGETIVGPECLTNE